MDQVYKLPSLHINNSSFPKAIVIIPKSSVDYYFRTDMAVSIQPKHHVPNHYISLRLVVSTRLLENEFYT